MNLRDWLFHRRRREEELDEEVQAHLRMAAQERIQQGESPRGSSRFGNPRIWKRHPGQRGDARHVGISLA